MTVELFFPGKLRNPLNTHGSTRGRIGEGLAWKNVVRICWLAAAKPSLQGPAVVQMTARVSRPWDSQEGLGAACKHIRDEAVRLILDGNPPRLTDKNGRLYDTPANDGPASGHLFLPVKQEIVKPGERGVLITIEPLNPGRGQTGDEAMSKLILDLCAGTGAWSEPYLKAGYDVVRVDLPDDVRLMQAVAVSAWKKPFGPVHGVLAAPPCTVFSYARNRYPPTDDELRGALSVVDACVRLAICLRPRWWALENPVNKLRRYLGPPAWTFRQWQYGDPGEKPTALWGCFNAPMYRVGRRTKPSTWQTKKQNAEPWDAITPPHFAQAFYEANP